MKRWILNILCLLLPLGGMAANAQTPQRTEDGKRILIINSYSKQLEWIDALTDSLNTEIRRKHPDWQVFSANLKTEVATYTAAATLTLRSILWGYAERTKTKVDATDLRISSCFIQDDMPDVLVWMGDEGFLNYLSYVSSMGKWKQIPMVLCMVNDSVSAYGWRPERSFQFDRMYGIWEYYTTTRYVPLNTSLTTYANDENVELTKVVINGKDMYRVDYFFDYSGVVASCPVRENLELIHHLMPELKELIWVDTDYYSSMKIRLEVERLMKEVMPDVRYNKMIHNRMNTDSIYDVMLEPAEQRAFLSFSANIGALYSKRSDEHIDSLFTHVATVPLFTLTKRNFENDNYWVGGCYLKSSVAIDKTMALLERAMRGDSLMSVPFDTVRNVELVLNRTAVERYGLSKEADRLNDVQFVHIPPSLFRKYESFFLISGLVLVILLCYGVNVSRQRRYNKHLKVGYTRYKRLYDKLQIIYENSSIDFAMYDKKGQCLLRVVNGEEKLDAYAEGGLFPENIFDSSYLTDEQKVLIRDRQVVNCEIESSGSRLLMDSAEQGVYQIIVKPLQKADYHPACLIAIAINLTPVIRERREKKHFETLFQFASNSSQIGSIFYDIATAEGMATNSWCVTMNETFTSGTFPAYSQVLAEDRSVLLNYQLDIRAGRKPEPICRDIRVMGDDGEIHWVRQHMYFVREYSRLIELSLNIDAQKGEERALEEAKLKAEQSNEETERFLSSISHEVRTPLNAIVGFSGVIAGADSEENRHEFSSIILRNVHLLDALISNILDLSTLDAGTVKFNYTRLNIADLFLDMEAYICNNLYASPLQVIRELPTYEEERFICTDQQYLRMLLQNLVANALKFTITGSITLGCRKDAGKFYFYVKDTGCGISGEDQKHIFNRFVKVDSYMQGTGLGLALCKSIVEHLGGEIGVVSELGQGSTFWFTIEDKNS